MDIDCNNKTTEPILDNETAVYLFSFVGQTKETDNSLKIYLEDAFFLLQNEGL